MNRYREQAFLSRRLVKIDCRVPVSFCARVVQNQKNRTTNACRNCSRIWSSDSCSRLFRKRPDRKPARPIGPLLTKARLNTLSSSFGRQAVLPWTRKPPLKTPWKARLVGLSFATQPDEALLHPLQTCLSRTRLSSLTAQWCSDRLRPVAGRSPISRKSGRTSNTTGWF